MENTTAIIEQLAQQLGTTAEYLWGVLVNQAAVYASIMALTFILGILMLTAFIFYWRWAAKNWDEKIYPRGESTRVIHSILVAASILVTTIILPTGLFEIKDIMTAIFNPEYWALQQVLDALR